MVDGMLWEHVAVGSNPIIWITDPDTPLNDAYHVRALNFYIKKRMDYLLKEITMEEMNLLIAEGLVKHSGKGIVDKRGNIVSYMSTKHKQYIADEYVSLAQKIMKKKRT